MRVAIGRPTVARARSAFEGELLCYEYIDEHYDVDLDLIARSGHDLDTSLNVVEVDLSVAERLAHLGREAITKMSRRNRVNMPGVAALYDVIVEGEYDVVETSDPTLYPETDEVYRACQATGAGFVPTVSSTKALESIVPPDRTQTMFDAAHALLFISPQVHERLADEGYLPADDDRAIYRGHPIDTDRFSCVESDGDAIDVVTVGVLEERKGIKEIAQAVERIATDQDGASDHDDAPEEDVVPEDVRWHVVGDGPLASWLDSFVSDAGIGDRVERYGQIDHERMPSMYELADVFALHSLETPTWEEYFGVVYAEAMSSCVPVVGSQSGVIPWLVRDGQDGILVPERDVDGIADALERLIADPELRREMGDSGRENVEERFAMEAVAEQFVGAWRRAGRESGSL
jgi:glycosyltransferase involved in cell wall biosynthesis